MVPSYKNLKIFKDTERKIPDLPDELSENILSRLPAEFLWEYRGVSKSWFALISSKRFVNIHLENSNKDNGLGHLGVVSESNNCLELCSLQSLLCEQSIDAIDLLPYTTIYANKQPSLVGCIDGLCCMMTDETHFSLLNPCLKKIKTLSDESCNGYVSRYGFGFDESNNDYKVLASVIKRDFRYYRADKIYRFETNRYTKIYSLKTDSWKMIEYFDVDGSPEESRGIFLKGKLHWLVQGESMSNIAYFDLGSEVHGSLELPSSVDGHLMSPLGVIRGCLGFFHDSNNETNFWISSQYGVKESWVKLVSISHVGNLTNWTAPLLKHKPLYISRNGDEILLFNKTNFVIYYTRLGYFRSLRSNKRILDASVYVKTLVSPFCFDEPSEKQNKEQCHHF